MKKIITLLIALIMGISLLTGCGDPVADEFETFLNTDMVDINANYDKLKEESAKWENLESNEDIANSISNVILPLINDSLDKLSKIELETEEVKAIKAKYEPVLNTYKEGYETMLEACKTNDESAADKATAKIDEGIKQLDEYNQALEALAKEKDMSVEY